MKRILFILVSTIVAGTSFLSFAATKMTNQLTNSKKQYVQQQHQLLTLDKPAAQFGLFADHYSHSSHVSHSSHESHSSHYSAS